MASLASSTASVFSSVSCCISTAGSLESVQTDSRCQFPHLPKYHPATWRQRWQEGNWDDQNDPGLVLPVFWLTKFSHIRSTSLRFKKVKIPISRLALHWVSRHAFFRRRTDCFQTSGMQENTRMTKFGVLEALASFGFDRIFCF